MERIIRIVIIIAVVLLVSYFMRKRDKKKSEKKEEESEVLLTEEEKQLLNKLDIDHNVGIKLKKATKNSLEGLYKRYLIDDEQPELSGIKSKLYPQTQETIVDDKKYIIAQNVKESINRNEYQIFNCGGYASEDYYIGIVKTSDPYQLLQIQETNGLNYEVETQQIIDFLKKWDRQASFVFIEVEADTVRIKFRHLGFDLDAFCNEAVELCPDIDDSKNFKNLIEQTKSADFWWD